jgi:hypothetical protein
MTFSAGFLTAIVFGSLAWCALAALALAVLLIKDLASGETW